MCVLMTICSSSSSSKISPSYVVGTAWRSFQMVQSDLTRSPNTPCSFPAVKSCHSVQPSTSVHLLLFVLVPHFARFITTGLGLVSSSKIVVFHVVVVIVRMIHGEMPAHD